jgi:hypothetical protein
MSPNMRAESKILILASASGTNVQFEKTTLPEATMVLKTFFYQWLKIILIAILCDINVISLGQIRLVKSLEKGLTYAYSTISSTIKLGLFLTSS